MNGDRDPPDSLTDLADWFRYRPPPDPRETWRRDLGEQQRRTVKRRRKGRKTPRKEA